MNMELLQDYRHVVDKKTKKIFVDSIKKVIKNFNLDNIGFIGVLGSVKEKYSHDIDILFFPSENAKIGESIISLINFYDQLEKSLKRKNERFYLSCCVRKNLQEMTYYLASLQEGSAGIFPVHSLFFPDYKSFKKFNPEDFQKEIKKSLITLHGNFNIIKKLRNDLPLKDLEPYFLILDFELNSKLKTFPRHLIRTSAESLFSYLKSKYFIKISKRTFHDSSDVEKEIFNILRQLDKKVYH